MTRRQKRDILCSMKLSDLKKPNNWLSALGLVTLSACYVIWLLRRGGIAPLPLTLSLLSAGCFAWVGLRTVPEWVGFWSDPGEDPLAPEETEPRYMDLRIFGCFLLADLCYLGLTILIRRLFGQETPMSFWLCADSLHYQQIAQDWYLSEGIRDRVVQLVFLPGYPVVLRLLHLLIPDYTLAGLTVSALSFAGGGCVFYRLLRLDYSRSISLRALRFLCMMPGAVFFAMPMSESLFFLLSVSCLYAARRERWLLAGLLGAYAAFTRSLGLALVVPLFAEWIHEYRRIPHSRRISGGVSVLLVPMGFAAYCYINYLVSGNPFQYLEYQSVHWHQNLGFFFSTAAYQTDYALSAARSHDLPSLLGLWLPNLICALSSLPLVALASRKLRASWLLWFMAYYIIAIGPTWLLSAPRYLLALPPLPLAMALFCRDSRRNQALSLLLGDFSFFYLIAFSLRWQVW